VDCVVTGGAGFIGSNLVGALVARGDRVTVIDDLSSGFARNLEPYPGVRLMEASVLDEEAVATAVDGAQAVFHLAASVGNKRSLDNPLVDSQVNVLGTLNVARACRRAGVRKLVYSSSAGVFGELKHLPIREDHPVEPDSLYGASKLAGEKLCLAYGKLYGVKTIALRYFNVYGPNQRFDQYGNVVPIFVFSLLRGEPITVFGDGEQTRDFVSVRDVVQANLKAAGAKGVTGVFNVASGTRITVNELLELIAGLIPTDHAVRYGPPRRGDVRHSLADIAAAQRAFGYEPSVRISEGLAEYVRWAQGEMARS
jgi:UDP-glucose 4-epimerase